MSHKLRVAALALFGAGIVAGACDSEPSGQCGALDDEPIADAVGATIEIKNVGATPLYLGSPGDRHDVIDFSIDGVMWTDDPGFPALHCATIESNFDSLCAEEPLEKDREALVRIDPGASYFYEWDGYVWEYLNLATDYAECIADPGCPQNVGASCHAGRTVALESMLSLRVTGNSSCVMPGGGECACPDAQLACEIPLPINFDALADALPSVTLDVAFTGDPIVIEIGG